MRTSATWAIWTPRLTRTTPSPSCRPWPEAPSVARFESVIDLIGNTPLVDVTELSPNPRVQILAKLEGQNPGGSVKDRPA
ncbi:MAG TPA: pyridoxal-phosphate dependent enzyme, partial [Acidimicrobiales bacterium]|nr:pyridoxal-phosphate dependent enzyme [Acidimicrobiales bacterium]